MKRLISIELLKLRNYRAFWILISLYLVSMILTLWFAERIVNGMIEGGPTGTMYIDVDSFPDGWHNMTYMAGFFTYILMVVVVFNVSSEFTYKTIRQNVINGLSPTEFFVGKLLLIVIITGISTLLIGLTTFVAGILDDGVTNFDWMFGKSYMLLAYFVQTLGYMLFATVLTLLIKRSGIVIGIIFIYTWFIENIARAYFGDEKVWFLPIRSLNLLVENPFIVIIKGSAAALPDAFDFMVAGFYILAFSGICLWYLRTRDL